MSNSRLLDPDTRLYPRLEKALQPVSAGIGGIRDDLKSEANQFTSHVDALREYLTSSRAELRNELEAQRIFFERWRKAAESQAEQMSGRVSALHGDFVTSKAEIRTAHITQQALFKQWRETEEYEFDELFRRERSWLASAYRESLGLIAETRDRKYTKRLAKRLVSFGTVMSNSTLFVSMTIARI